MSFTPPVQDTYNNTVPSSEDFGTIDKKTRTTKNTSNLASESKKTTMEASNTSPWKKNAITGLRWLGAILAALFFIGLGTGACAGIGFLISYFFAKSASTAIFLAIVFGAFGFLGTASVTGICIQESRMNDELTND